MPQTTVTTNPPIAYAGLLADADSKTRAISTIVDETAGIAPGLLVVRGNEGDRTASSPRAAAADPDSIVEALASAAAPIALSGVALDGVIGGGRISPPARITVTLNSHADWNATTLPLTFEDEDGNQVTENLAIPDAGNTVLTTSAFASRFISGTMPAQGGTNGSFTVGTAASGIIGSRDALGVSLHTHKALVNPASEDNEVYEDECQMPVLEDGDVYVKVETAFSAGDGVFVRLTAAGAEQLGAFRTGNSDSGDCVPFKHARLKTSGSAGGFGVLGVSL